MYNPRILFCKITSFIGSIGAEHYYGKMINKDNNEKKMFTDMFGDKNNEVELRYPMSQKEATYMNKKDSYIIGMRKYKAGDLTNRYNTEQEVRNAAVKFLIDNKLEKHYDFIMECDGSSCPARCIWAKDENKMKELNEAYDKWDKSSIDFANFRRASAKEKDNEEKNMRDWERLAFKLGVLDFDVDNRD